MQHKPCKSPRYLPASYKSFGIRSYRSHQKLASVSPLDSALTSTRELKSFRMRSAQLQKRGEGGGYARQSRCAINPGHRNTAQQLRVKVGGLLRQHFAGRRNAPYFINVARIEARPELG